MSVQNKDTRILLVGAESSTRIHSLPDVGEYHELRYYLTRRVRHLNHISQFFNA